VKRIALLIWIVVLVPGLVGFVPPRQGQVSLAVQVGYAGYFREGHWIPVLVTIQNKGDAINGEVRVRTDGVSGLSETTYRTPLELNRDARQQIFLYVSLQSSTQKVQVEIVDQNQHVVQSISSSIHVANQSDILHAVVTESASGAIDLTSVKLGTGRSHQANWAMENIPPLADALSGLDVMLFYDVNTVGLDTQAIQQWVMNGGHLIVAGGNSWRGTVVGLEPLLPVTPEGTVELESLVPLATYLRVARGPLDDTILATQSTPLAHTQTLLEIDGVPIIVRWRYGGGVVDFLAVAPNEEPLRSWNDKNELWHTLLSSVNQQPSWSKGIQNWDLAREATLTTSNAVLPTFIQLCGFLVLYIVLVGPLNYMILRRMNRREWAWLTIPVLIGLFSVLAYTVGFNLRGNVAIVNRLTVARVWPGNEQAHVTGLLGIQSPRRAAYTAAVDRGMMLRTLPEIGTGLSGPATITEGTRFMAEDVPIDAGTVASFVTNGYAEAPLIEAAAVWHLNDTPSPSIEVRIKNLSSVTLNESVFLIKGVSREIGSSDTAAVFAVKDGSGNVPLDELQIGRDLVRCGSGEPGGDCSAETLGPGQVAIITASIAGSLEPGALGIGTSDVLMYGPYYTNNLPYSYRSWGCFNQQLSATVLDVMLNEPFPCGTSGINNRGQEIRKRYRLLGSLIDDTDLSGGRGAGAYLFAWTDKTLVNVELVGKVQTEEDTTLYIFELPVTIEAESSIVEVPPGLTTWTLTELDDPNTMVDVTPNLASGVRVDGNRQAAFQFRPMPEMRLKTVDEIYIRFGGRGALVISLWDWNDQVWVNIPYDPNLDRIVVSNPGDYLGPENAVRVRVTSDGTQAYNEFDYIKVGYRGALVEG